MNKIIDISSHNTIESFSEIAKNVDAAIVRLGYRGYGKAGNLVVDNSFENNVNKCMAYAIPFGVYFFPTSISESEACEEAEFIISHIKAIYSSMRLPIFLDSEIAETKNKSGRSDNLTATTRTKLLNIIIGKLRTAGYECGVYASKAWFNSRLTSDLVDCPRWVAEWATKLTYTGRVDLWQYTSYGELPGIKGRVDLSELKNEKIWRGLSSDTEHNIADISAGVRVPAYVNIDIFDAENKRITGWTLPI